MATSRASLKRRFLDLLKVDEEFRLAVAGLIGLEEILKNLNVTQQELAKLREDMVKGFERHDQELAKLREDMIAGFKRHDEELTKLREDMTKGFEIIDRRISSLGARWGIMSETSFRQGLKEVLERNFNVKVERWREFDDEGYVFKRPSEVEIDIAVSNGQIILIEISSHVRKSDVYVFKNKCEFFMKKTGKTPSKLIIITPYAENDAVSAAKELGIEIYTST
ncbi:MAG: DUF3782 domain-containing protein [Thermofilaceae archaeon]